VSCHGDDSTAQTTASSSSTANTTTTVLEGVAIVQVAAGVAFTYLMAYASSSAIAMKYSLHLTAELL
jgi:hypothetical protein